MTSGCEVGVFQDALRAGERRDYYEEEKIVIGYAILLTHSPGELHGKIVGRKCAKQGGWRGNPHPERISTGLMY